MKQTRTTAAKTAILNLINTSESALSHTEIQSALHGICDRVTIYRVLDRLLEEGLIHKIVNTDGGVKYAACTNCTSKHQHNHIHFSCQKCKSVTCLKDIQPSFTLPEKYQIVDVNFTVTGICALCA